MEQTRECAIEECRKPVKARGLCESHYYRAKRAGTLDELAPAPTNPCEHCGGPIPKGRRWGAQFCSPECKQKELDARKSREAREIRAARVRHCGWCREVLSVDKRAHAKFCSTSCADSWNNKQKSLIADRAKKALRRPCEVCGKPIPESRRADAAYCSVACKRSASQSGSERSRHSDFVRQLQVKYKLTLETYEAMLTEQGNRCAICGRDDWPGKDNRPHVDHCHKSTKVRGILCSHCNHMLGNAMDNPEILAKGIAYLHKHT